LWQEIWPSKQNVMEGHRPSKYKAGAFRKAPTNGRIGEGFAVAELVTSTVCVGNLFAADDWVKV